MTANTVAVAATTSTIHRPASAQRTTIPRALEAPIAAAAAPAQRPSASQKAAEVVYSELVAKRTATASGESATAAAEASELAALSLRSALTAATMTA